MKGPTWVVEVYEINFCMLILGKGWGVVGLQEIFDF